MSIKLYYLRPVPFPIYTVIVDGLDVRGQVPRQRKHTA